MKNLLIVLFALFVTSCAVGPALDSDVDADFDNDMETVSIDPPDADVDSPACYPGETACWCNPEDQTVFWIRSCFNGEFSETEFNTMTQCPAGYRCVMASTRPDSLVALCVEMPTPDMNCIR